MRNLLLTILFVFALGAIPHARAGDYLILDLAGQGERMAVTVAVRGQHLFLNCSEPLATWGADQQPTLRLMARVPLGQDHVADVAVKELKAGESIAARRLVWAVEEDRGERFLHVKVLFPQPAPQNFAALQAGARAAFDVVTTRHADAAQMRFVGEEGASP